MHLFKEVFIASSIIFRSLSQLRLNALVHHFGAYDFRLLGASLGNDARLKTHYSCVRLVIKEEKFIKYFMSWIITVQISSPKEVKSLIYLCNLSRVLS